MYVFAGHGFLGETELPTRSNPRHRKRDRAVGGMLGRRPSLTRRPKDHAVLMQECFAATPPGLTRRRKLVTDTFVPDPLADASQSQHVANETGRTVYGATQEVGFKFEKDGRVSHYIIMDSRGRRGKWVKHRPEPDDAALDDRARAAGLHTDPVGPASEEVRERTLRLVRALRLTFGVAIEDDSRYGELLAGIGALESLRAADPALRDTVPFSLDLFERAAREIRATEHGDPDGDLGPDAYEDLLARAADAVHRNPGAVLTDLVTLPHVITVAEGLDGLTDEEVNEEAARLLGLDPDQVVIGAPERARFFWATVKALEWESRTPTRPPSPAGCCTWAGPTRTGCPTSWTWWRTRRPSASTWTTRSRWARSTWSPWAPSRRTPCCPTTRAPRPAGAGRRAHRVRRWTSSPPSSWRRHRTAATDRCAGPRCRGPPTPPNPPRTWCGARPVLTTSPWSCPADSASRSPTRRSPNCSRWTRR